MDIEYYKTENERIVKQNKELQQELMPFRDKYFNGLSTKDIAELAKKSIRITAENRNLINWLNRVIYCYDTATIPNNMIEDIRKDLKEKGELEV